MSEVALRRLISYAVVDTHLCAKLLNGERESILDQFDLDEAERVALGSIEADTLQAFAEQLDLWMRRKQASPAQSAILMSSRS